MSGRVEMSTEVPVSPGPTEPAPAPSRAGWKDWTLVAACALFLLIASQALWLWQTWPVRELLQAAPASSSPVVPR